MAVRISGVLKDGAGKPIQNCTIQLKARRNSTTVVVNTVASENPDEAGRYTMDVEYGQYSVSLLVEGFPPSHAGIITVYEDSNPRQRALRQRQNGQRILHPPWRLRMRARRKRG